MFKPTIDGTKCGNPKLGNTRSRSFQTYGQNYYNWNSQQRNFQAPQNVNYHYNQYYPKYPQYQPTYRNYQPYQPPRTQVPYQPTVQYSYYWNTPRNSWPTSYMTTTSTTTTTTTTRRTRPTRGPPRRSFRPRPTRSPNQVHQMIIPVNNGQFKSCSADTFSKLVSSYNILILHCSAMGHDDQPKLPPITVKSFYMPHYGAGRKGSHFFDPNKNYLGIIIMAIHSKGQWYNDHSKSFT